MDSSTMLCTGICRVMNERGLNGSLMEGLQFLTNILFKTDNCIIMCLQKIKDPLLI